MTTDDNTFRNVLSGSWRAFIKCFHKYKFFLLFPPFLAIIAGLTLMGLLARGADKEIES